MPIVINTNLNSITAQRSLETVNRQLTQSIQRLSSGLRINSARDDASGLVIATRLTSQIRGLNAAVRNLSDGISLVQTAEGGISSITSNLQRIRELAVQSANITLTETERAALQSEVTLAREEITRVAQQTTFNGRVLLNGGLGPGNFVAGANITDVLSFSGIEDLRATALGFNQATGLPPTPVGEGPGGVPGFTRTNLQVLPTGTSTAQSITVLGTTYTLGSFAPGARDLANAINGLGVAGLNAAVGANTINGSIDSSYVNYFDPEGTLTINGVDIALVGSRSNNFSQNVDAAVAAINARSIDTGVVASNGVSQGNGLILT
ncbi:MAG: flagellin, partial [Steroidobacteraceae bacterium]